MGRREGGGEGGCVCVCVCMCVFVCMCVPMYVCTPTHPPTHTHRCEERDLEHDSSIREREGVKHMDPLHDPCLSVCLFCCCCFFFPELHFKPVMTSSAREISKMFLLI